jgi:DNA repair protein RecO (recombination protein O)
MQLRSSDAIILDVFNLHDYDRIVTLLTRSHGKKKGVARGARRKYSRFAGQLQPLAKVSVTWLEKEQSELARVSSVELERSASGLQSDLEGILLGSYLADHMLEFAQENEPNDHLFRLLDSTLDALLADVDRGLAARYYEAWVLRIAGVFPAPSECPACGRGLEKREVGVA